MNISSCTETIRNFLDQYLQDRSLIDIRKPECTDVVDKLPKILNSFMVDAIKEFNKYPLATLSWMMYVGMAVSKFWDVEWNIYNNIDDLYKYLRDKRGYDALDDYICEEVLCLNTTQINDLQKIVMSCASGIYDILIHSEIEPGTPESFRLIVDCFKQMYLYGIYMELHSLGYHMTKLI